MSEKETIIRNYIEGYNAFDLEKMMKDIHPDIVFENISQGQVNLRLTGIEAFREQAAAASRYFSERRQSVRSIDAAGEETRVAIDYQARLAMDLPEGLKKGEEIRLQGWSVFRFADNKIVHLKDIS